MMDQTNGKQEGDQLIVPTYVRFSAAQLERIEQAQKRQYITSRSDFIRAATMREVDRILEGRPQAA